MERLADAWFSDKGGEENSTLEKFVFSGGAYGRQENGVALKKNTKGGRLGYLMHRLFVPYAQLKRYYPVLNKHPYLLPFFEVKRWFDALRRDRSRYIQEFKENMENGASGEIRLMLDDLGLT